jgi:hypothetical protein
MALAYVLLYSGLRVVAPSTAVTASLVEPVTAAVAAAAVLDESLGPVAVVGILLVLGAVAGLGRPTAAAGPVLPDPAGSQPEALGYITSTVTQSTNMLGREPPGSMFSDSTSLLDSLKWNGTTLPGTRRGSGGESTT